MVWLCFLICFTLGVITGITLMCMVVISKEENLVEGAYYDIYKQNNKGEVTDEVQEH